MVTENVSVQLFCLYDQDDKRGFKELEEHFKSTIRSEEILSIEDILAGKHSKEVLSRFLSNAQIVIVLLSAALLNSWRDEIKDALQRAKSGELRLLPVLYKPVLIEYSELGKLQIIPRDGKAIHGRDENERNKIWISIVKEILKIREEILAVTNVSIDKKAEKLERSQNADRKEQQEQDPTRPATVFVSYAPDAGQHCEQLQLLLRLRGLKIWRRDSEDLPFTGLRESAAARAVRELADAYLLYLTPEALKKPQLWLPEARVALERHEQKPEFPIVLILERVTQRRVQNFLEKLGLSKLREFIRSELEPEASSEAIVSGGLRSLARVILRETFRQRQCRARAGTDYAPFIGITHFRDSEITTRLDLELNWYDFFQGKSKLPSEQEWNDWLWPALADVKELLSKHARALTLYLALKAIIPVGFAVGLMFKETTGFKLAVKNSGPASREAAEERYWHTAVPEIDLQLLRLIDSYNPGGDPATAVVEIAISPPFGPQLVPSYLDQHRLSYCYRQRYEVRTDKKTIDEREAQSMMYEIRKGLRMLPHRYETASERIKSIHLFAAMPIALAVMIGHQLNTLLPITVYEYRSPDGYLPACVLDNRRISF